LGMDWVELGQLFGELGWVWVDEMGPWTTLITVVVAIAAAAAAVVRDCSY